MTHSHLYDLAGRGFHIFPLIPGTKRPMIRDWENRATTDRAALDAWPADAGVGIACGPSKLVVLDLDAHGGEPPAKWAQPGIRDGMDVLAAVWAEHDLETSFLHTYTVQTPSGGLHCYFRAPERDVRNSAGRIGWQVDVRAQGGYVVGPGTVIDTDHGPKPYELVYTPADLPVLPEWLTALLVDHTPVVRPLVRRGRPNPSGAGKRIDGILQSVAEAPEGERNNRLNWAGYTLRSEGLLDGAMCERLARAAQSAGLPATEIRATLASVLRMNRGAAA